MSREWRQGAPGPSTIGLTIVLHTLLDILQKMDILSTFPLPLAFSGAIECCLAIKGISVYGCSTYTDTSMLENFAKTKCKVQKLKEIQNQYSILLRLQFSDGTNVIILETLFSLADEQLSLKNLFGHCTT